ncbi:hypothetical protein [Brevibacillus porteri]|uniref:hypothetical protein n=1 Tax=Brevibacillus porteri TaxID=2126350 RepID=UPI003638EF1B
MKNLELGQKVKALFNGEKVVEGIIYDMTDITVWVENWEDIYPCKIETVEDIEVAESMKVVENKQKYEVNEEKVIQYLKEVGWEYSLCDNGDATDISIDGFNYFVSVYVSNKGFELSTVHKERSKKESSNKLNIVKFNTLVKKLEYFLNK